MNKKKKASKAHLSAQLLMHFYEVLVVNATPHDRGLNFIYILHFAL